MRPRLSLHALEEAKRRAIPVDLLETILERPEHVVTLSTSLAVYQSRISDDDGKPYLIRAIVSLEVDPGLVVTVYRTSKIAKYWRPS